MRYGPACLNCLSSLAPASFNQATILWKHFYIRRGTIGDFRLGGSVVVIREISQALAVTFSRPKIWVK